MRHILIVLCWVAALMPATAQHKIIVCIGSSTTAGTGSTPNPNPINPNDPPDSCFASIVKRYFLGLGLIDTLVNLGRPTTTTYDGLPTGSATPDNHIINDDYNVSAALTKYNADVVIVNFPTNDVFNHYPATATLANLQTIYNTVVNAGKICFITTTQPRTSLDPDQKLLLKSERNMILDQFGANAINFYNPIVGADSLNINTIYNFGDGTHVNNAGHRLLAQTVINANVLNITPLPITLTGFTAVRQQQQIVLSWTGMDQSGAPAFVVQRSPDGTSFIDQTQLAATGSAMAQNYSWTDPKPLTGKSYYRIKISEQGLADHYSPIVAVLFNTATWNISKLYRTGGATWNIEIQSGKTTNFQLRVIDADGRPYLRQSITVSSPSRLIPLNLSGLAGGQYFVQLVSDQGEMSGRAILKE